MDEELPKGLEFTNISKAEVKGELQEFIEILLLLAKMKEIGNIKIIVDYLPEGTKWKKFSILGDEITRRYAIGKVAMTNEMEILLIEVEIEDRALSMLIIKGINLMNWKLICGIILLGLVNESGKWSNVILDNMKSNNIYISRIRHIGKNKYAKVK